MEESFFGEKFKTNGENVDTNIFGRDVNDKMPRLHQYPSESEYKIALATYEGKKEETIKGIHEKYLNGTPRSLEDISFVYREGGYLVSSIFSKNSGSQYLTEILTENNQNQDLVSLFATGEFNGDLDLDRFELATTFPDNAKKINGNFSLKKTPIKHLPDGLEVSKDFYLNSDTLENLPDNLSIKGNLRISNPIFTHIPTRLTVGGDFNIFFGRHENKDTPISFGEEIRIKGECSFNYRQKTLILPKDIKFEGGLSLSGKKVELPDNFKIGGSLSLVGCDSFEFPKNLEVGNDLHLTFPEVSSIFTNIESNPEKGNNLMTMNDFSDLESVYGKDISSWSDRRPMMVLKAMLSDMTVPRTIDEFLRRRLNEETRNSSEVLDIIHDEKRALMSFPTIIDIREKATRISSLLLNFGYDKIDADSDKFRSLLLKAQDTYVRWKNEVVSFFNNYYQPQTKSFTIENDEYYFDKIKRKVLSGEERKGELVYLYQSDTHTGSAWDTRALLECLKDKSGKISLIMIDELTGESTKTPHLTSTFEEKFPNYLFDKYPNSFRDRKLSQSCRAHDYGGYQIETHIDTSEMDNKDIDLILKKIVISVKSFAEVSRKTVQLPTDIKIKGKIIYT